MNKKNFIYYVPIVLGVLGLVLIITSITKAIIAPSRPYTNDSKYCDHSFIEFSNNMDDEEALDNRGGNMSIIRRNE